MWLSIVAFFKRRWKEILLVGAAIGIFVNQVLKGNMFKGLLRAANKSHKKDNEANQKYIDTIEAETEKIEEKLEKDLETSSEKFEKEKDDLEKRKKEYINNSKNKENIGKEIADYLGAEYIKVDD